MASVTVGKAKVNIDIEGCIYCGASWSSEWKAVKTLDIRIGSRQIAIQVHACADCMKSRKHQPELGL